nr:hypothetical protein [Candidatus Ruthturnera calyptogenae]
MALFIKAAKKRKDTLDHCLIYSSLGLVKSYW